MKAKEYDVMSRAVEDGIEIGLRRAYKHRDTSPGTGEMADLRREIFNGVMFEIIECLLLREMKMSKITKLSERVRPGSEVAPWVLDEIHKMEDHIDFLERELRQGELGHPSVKEINDAYDQGYKDALYENALATPIAQPNTVADGEARFKLEEHIMDVWRITHELSTLSEYVIESGESAIAKQDKVSNMLIGLEQLYEVKFDNLWRQFEKMIHDKQIV